MADTRSTPKTDAPGNTRKDPEDWVTGDEPMTGAQASYLKTLCEETGEKRARPTERDAYQVDSEWMAVSEAERCRLFPRAVRDNLRRMIESEHTMYLGSERKK